MYLVVKAFPALKCFNLLFYIFKFGQACFRNLGLAKFKNVKEQIELFEVNCNSRKDVITVIDPVCRMQVNKNITKANLIYEDKAYYFCSLDCAKKFMEDPQNYIQ